MAFYCIPCWRYPALSQHFHDAPNACTAPSWLHTSLTACHTMFVQTPRTTTAFAQWPLCRPVELMLPCRRPYCAAMMTLRRPHCTHIRMLSDGICSKCVPSFGVLCNPTASTGDATVLLWCCLRLYSAHFGVLHFSWTPWDHSEKATLVWQGFKM